MTRVEYGDDYGDAGRHHKQAPNNGGLNKGCMTTNRPTPETLKAIPKKGVSKEPSKPSSSTREQEILQSSLC